MGWELNSACLEKANVVMCRTFLKPTWAFLKPAVQAQRPSFSKPLQELWLLKISLKQGLAWVLKDQDLLEFRIWQAASKLLKDESLVGLYLMLIKKKKRQLDETQLSFGNLLLESQAFWMLLLVSLSLCCRYWKGSYMKKQFHLTA